MRTDPVYFVIVSRSRVNAVKTLLEYPDRQWSCSALEDLTKLPHSNVFRTLKGLASFGILKQIKLNKKTVIYELVKDSPFLRELKRVINSSAISLRGIVRDFVDKVRSKEVYSIVLYGSAIKGKIKPDSDIDMLVVLKKHDKKLEKSIFDVSAGLSSKFNRTISPVIMDLGELNRTKKDDPFILSIKTSGEVVYGKKPFRAG